MAAQIRRADAPPSSASPSASASASASGLSLEEIGDPIALEGLRPEWRTLFESDPKASPFQSPEWLLAWRAAFVQEGLWCLAVRRQGRLVGLAPFFIHTDAGDGARQLTLLGNGVSDRLDLLAQPGWRAQVAEAVARRVRERRDLWDCCDLRDLPAASPLLSAALAPGGAERLEPEEPCPALALPASFEALVASLPRSRRTDLARCERRLSERGPLSFSVAAGREALHEHFEALRRLQGARWRAGAGVLSDEAALGFHQAVLPGLMQAGLLRLYALRLGERIVAAHYALRRGAWGYSYLHAFDPRLAAYGPGWVLMARSLQALIGEGVRRFDFLRGREAYKYAWGAADQPQWRRRISR